MSQVEIYWNNKFHTDWNHTLEVDWRKSDWNHKLKADRSHKLKANWSHKLKSWLKPQVPKLIEATSWKPMEATRFSRRKLQAWVHSPSKQRPIEHGLVFARKHVGRGRSLWMTVKGNRNLVGLDSSHARCSTAPNLSLGLTAFLANMHSIMNKTHLLWENKRTGGMVRNLSNVHFQECGIHCILLYPAVWIDMIFWYTCPDFHLHTWSSDHCHAPKDSWLIECDSFSCRYNGRLRWCCNYSG